MGLPDELEGEGSTVDDAQYHDVRLSDVHGNFPACGPFHKQRREQSDGQQKTGEEKGDGAEVEL